MGFNVDGVVKPLTVVAAVENSTTEYRPAPLVATSNALMRSWAKSMVLSQSAGNNDALPSRARQMLNSPHLDVGDEEMVGASETVGVCDKLGNSLGCDVGQSDAEGFSDGEPLGILEREGFMEGCGLGSEEG